MDQSLIIKLNQGTLNLIKIQIVTKDVNQEEKMVYINSLMVSETDRTVVHTDVINMPTSSPYLDENENNKSWYEQSMFFVPSILTNSIEIIVKNVDASYELIVRTSPIFVKYGERNTLKSNFKQMEKVVVERLGEKYHLFLNTNIAISYIDDFTEKFKTKAPLSLKLRNTDIIVPASSITIGLIGDDTFYGILETSYQTVKLSIESSELISLNVFDIIIIQERSSQLIEFGTTFNEETTFINSMKAALLNTNTPIFTLKNEGSTGKEYSKLIPLRNCVDNDSYKVSEYEICNFLPLNTTKTLPTLLVPSASDLYQFQAFLTTVNELSSFGFLITVCEANYGHVVIRTQEKLNEDIKVYGTLSPFELAALARKSGFLLLNATTLRDIKEVYNLCAIAITSGAIPIVIGIKEDVPEFVKVVGSMSELYDFLLLYTDTILHEKEWMRRYRFFRNLQKNSQLKHVIGLYENYKTTKVRQEPSAVMLCVTKRIENINIIIENFQRQSYQNLQLHIIWNVDEKDKYEMSSIIKTLQYSNVKFTFIDQSYNIGYCLNYGIRSTEADYWFKIDDDDYYGDYYIEDMLHWYNVTNADSVGKPSAFVYFQQNNTTYLRNHAPRQMRTFLSKGQYLCGATLSGRKDRNLPLFSNYYRNSCDSKWVEQLTNKGYRVFISDIFNFIINRGDSKQHTWQVEEHMLTEKSSYIGECDLKGWIDAK